MLEVAIGACAGLLFYIAIKVAAIHRDMEN